MHGIGSTRPHRHRVGGRHRRGVCPISDLPGTGQERATIKTAWRCRLALVFVIATSAGILTATPPAAAVDNPAMNYRPPRAVRGDTYQAYSLVNRERVKAGCAPLRIASKLQAPADRQSRDQAVRDRSGHRGANGSTSNSRLSGLGYSRWAENTAQWQSAHKAVKFWLRSRGHRANMLNCAFSETGLAVARSKSGKLYWTQTFGG